MSPATIASNARATLRLYPRTFPREDHRSIWNHPLRHRGRASRRDQLGATDAPFQITGAKAADTHEPC